MALIFGIQFFHMPAVMLRDESDARAASHSQSTACEMQPKRHYVLSRRRGTFGVRTRPRVAFWGAGPLVEKRCEDASHSQLRKLSRGRTSRTQAGRQCEMPSTHSDLSISV